MRPKPSFSETISLQISEIKDSAHVPGLFYVVTSRTKHPKHNYIPDDQWPNQIEIQVQRLNPFVIGAEVFDRKLKIKACQTLRKISTELGNNYGESWTKEECEIADLVGNAWKAKICYSTVAIRQFIMSETGKKLNSDLLETVISKTKA